MKSPDYLLFVATFADGSQIFQNAEDVGQCEGKNCYFDVLQKELDVPLICFVRGGEGYPTIGVDLRDGHFEINGIPFFLHEEPLKDFRLFQTRHVTARRAMPFNAPPEDSLEHGYILGWETEYQGEIVKRVIKI
jgi:hypothetical protein